MPEKGTDGVMMVVPMWSHCLSCEYVLRLEAIKLTCETGMPIQSSLWAAHRDGEQRMEHRVTSLTMANCGRSSSGDTGKISEWEKQGAELQMAGASRPPRMTPRSEQLRTPLAAPPVKGMQCKGKDN